MSGWILSRRSTGTLLAVLIVGIVVMALRRSPHEAVPEMQPKAARASARQASSAEPDPTTAASRDPRHRTDEAPPKPPDAGIAGPPFADEDEYLRTLKALNLSDKQHALELVDRGDEWYPASGVRAEARKAMGITLLVDLGDMEEARARARRFIAAYPKSSYRPLVQGVTGIHPRPSGPNGELR